MSQAPEPTPEFWKLDLTRLTLAGWLLVLIASATVLGVAAAVLALVSNLFLTGSQGSRPSRFVGGVAVAIGIAAGAGVFALGQVGLRGLGLGVLRK